jgi:hypothetical protein
MKQENGKSNPYDVKAGEIWVEVDPRYAWVKEVLSVDEESGVATIKGIESGKVTKAMLNRFHGRRGGYVRR